MLAVWLSGYITGTVTAYFVIKNARGGCAHS
jgi:hypothetical protein